jgi:hypothetical protein
MTYRVVLANEWRNIVVEVDADNPRSAKEVATWIVEHRKHGEAHGLDALADGARRPSSRRRRGVGGR